MIDSTGAEPTGAAAQAQPPASIHALSFHGTGAALFALVLKNVVLTVLTLGIYMPWAKTQRRQYIWQNTEVAGHRLRYHGTGQELFIAYLKVAAGYAVFIGVPAVVGKHGGKLVAVAVQVVLLVLLYTLIPLAIWGSRRYLLSRTSWRGVRMRLEGSSRQYAREFFVGGMWSMLTLGVYAPVWGHRLYRIVTNATAIGTKSFEYRGQDKAIWRMALTGIPLSILTLGLYYFWYRARVNRYQMEHTWFDGARGELTLTGGDMLLLTLLQVIGLPLSLGLAFPWITAFSLEYTLRRIRFIGPIDYEHIYQAASDGDAVADGLADALDVGGAL